MERRLEFGMDGGDGADAIAEAMAVKSRRWWWSVAVNYVSFLRAVRM